MDSGWTLKKGAGGFSYWHDANRWATKVCDTQALAEAARDALEAGAAATRKRQEAERDELRRFYRSKPS